MKTVTENIVVGKPFVNHVNQEAKPTLEANEFLKRAYVRFYTNNDNIINYGYYKLMGYQYDLKPYLKKYLYKMYGNWQEAYAPNKTLLRKVLCSTVTKIVEV